MAEKDRVEETLADAALGRPREFFVGRRRFCLYPPSLAVSLLASRRIQSIGIDATLLEADPAMEAMRLVSSARREVSALIALHTLRGRRALTDSRCLSRRARLLSRSLADAELAQLLLVVLTEPGADTLLRDCGLAAERDRMKRISAIRREGGRTLTFGGKTLFGSLIGPAMETFHIPYETAVWEMSLVSLRLLLSDHISSVFLSDDEMKKLSAHKDAGEVGMTAADFERLRREYGD